MPRATVNTSTQKFQLESLPGGWVELKRMSFGQKMARLELTSRMTLQAEENNRSQRRSGRTGRRGGNMAGEVEMLQKKATLFAFQCCVVDHNLFADDAETMKLDLHSEQGIESLDPRVGEEIDGLIDDLNNFEAEEDGPENFSSASDHQS